MSRQRLHAFLLLAVSGGMFAYTSGSVVYVTVVLALAGAGATGRLRFGLPSSRRTIVSLALAVLFALKWQLAPFDDRGVSGFVSYPLMHAFAQYFLALSVMELFIDHRRGLPAILPLYGAAVMITAGNVFAARTAAELAIVYESGATVYVAVAMLYFDASLRRAPESRRTDHGRRALLGATLFACVLGCTYVGNRLLERNHREVSRWLAAIERQFLRGARGQGRAPGFTDDMALGSVVAVKDDRSTAVALRVRFDRPPGRLRAGAYDFFDGLRWRNETAARTLYPADGPLGAPVAQPPQQTFAIGADANDPASYVPMRIYPAGPSYGQMFAPLSAPLLRAPIDQVNVDDNRVVTSLLPERVPYAALVADGRPSGAVPPDAGMRRRYLQVPAGLDERIVRLARSVQAGARTPAARIAAVENHFLTHYEYRFGIDIPPGRQPLEYFLLDRPPAHCEYFASGAAVLLRLGGVPARYVAGFHVAERNPVGGYWVARNRDAHAWVEAWDDRRGRWVVVEATPPAGVPGGTETSSLDQWLDALKLAAQEFRVAIYLHGLWGLAGYLGRILLAAARWMVASPAGWALLAGIAAWGVWRLHRRRRKRSGESADLLALAELVARADRCSARLGYRRNRSETLRQFGRRLSAEPDGPAERLGRWYRQCSAARFAPGDRAARVEPLRRRLGEILRDRLRRRRSDPGD